MKKDGLILGWGVAGCSWIAERMGSEATVDLRDDGTARVSSATQDIGTGTYTVLSQIVSQKTGIPLDKIEVVLGDSALPPGAISGGSWATASSIPPVLEAIEKAQQTLYMVASQGKGPRVRGAEAGSDGLYQWMCSPQGQVSRQRCALRADSPCGQHPRRFRQWKVRGHLW